MKPIDYNNIEKQLGQIKRLEASDYLLIRIQQKIKADKEELVSTGWAWSLTIPFVILLIVNVTIFTSKINKDTVQQNLLEQMDLIDNNNLYY